MPQSALNKKILCFVDEYGTPTVSRLSFGVVLIGARQAGQLDKQLSDCLESTTVELHAQELANNYIKGILGRLRKRLPLNGCILLNHQCQMRNTSAARLYAENLIEAVKVGLKRYRTQVLRKSSISNVDLIVDVNQYSEPTEFDDLVFQEKGVSQAIRRISKLDSGAARLLQLADLVAYARKWLADQSMDAGAIHERFGIEISG